jgi:hypothetical protein
VQIPVFEQNPLFPDINKHGEFSGAFGQPLFPDQLQNEPEMEHESPAGKQELQKG